MHLNDVKSILDNLKIFTLLFTLKCSIYKIKKNAEKNFLFKRKRPKHKNKKTFEITVFDVSANIFCRDVRNSWSWVLIPRLFLLFSVSILGLSLGLEFFELVSAKKFTTTRDGENMVHVECNTSSNFRIS